MKASRNIIVCTILILVPFLSLQANKLQWKVLEDSGNQYDALSALEASKDIGTSEIQIFNFSYADYPVWLLSTIETQSTLKLFVENPTIGYLDFYIINHRGEIIKESQTGNYKKVSTREINYPAFVFEIPASEQTLTIVIKAKSNEPLIVPFNLIEDSNLSTYLFEREIIGLIVTGIIISLITLYIVIFISLRDTSYLLYLFFAATILVTILRLNGYTAFWLWPNAPVFNQYPAILEALPAITAAVFALYYLNLKTYYPLMSKFIIGMIGLQVLVIPISLISDGNVAVILCETVALIYIPIITVLSALVFFIKKYRPAKYFLISSIFLFTGSVIYILINFNAIEATNVFFRNSLQIGIALEMTFLAIGVSKRIEKLRKDYIQVQEENVRILSDKKEELKEQVAQQTADLAEVCWATCSLSSTFLSDRILTFSSCT